MTTRPPRRRVQAVAEDASATSLELFFDLVFVFALTQVTALMAGTGDVTGRHVAQGMIVLALVWWCWVGFSWLGNNVQADEGITRAAFLLVMATVFVAALAIPDAFDEVTGPGVSGAMVFAVCYSLVRVIHIALFAIAARHGSDGGLLRQLGRFGVVAAISIVLALVGAALGGDAQIWLWIAAITVDFVGTQAIGAGGWRLRSVRHFAERHGLIIIIALGESIVAVGVGVGAVSLTGPVIVTAFLGLAVVAAMWWVYFDVTSTAAERRFATLEGVELVRMARDAYTYIHLAMVAGIVLAALGMKKVLGYVAEEEGPTWGESLHGIPPAALHGGVALYLLALIALRIRVVHSISRSRSVAAVLLLATIPLASRIPAGADLALVAAISVGLIAFEAIRYAEARHRIRDEGGHAPRAADEPNGEPPS